MKHEKRKKRIEDLAKEMPEIIEISSKTPDEVLELLRPAQEEYEKQDSFIKKYGRHEIKEYTLINLSMACPEAYDVYKNDQQVAYFRVRYGLFSVRIPTSLGDTVYTAEVAGEACFEDDERDFYLHEGIEAVEVFYNGRAEQGGVY